MSRARDANVGAAAIIESLIPVNETIAAGMPMPGLTSELHSVTCGTPPADEASTRTIPISVMRSRAARVPVVSRSTKAGEGAKRRTGHPEAMPRDLQFYRTRGIGQYYT